MEAEAVHATRWLDVIILIVYFGAMASMGPYFARRNKTTEGYFVGNRSYPGWLIGISMFGTSISSITFVGYPGDAYKTAYLRFLLCLMLPVAIFVASKYFLPFFRRGKITSAFEYLEGRFGPKTRVYAAGMFLVGQVIRISLILFLVSLLMHELTGWNTTLCIVVGGFVTAFYTVAGGIEAVIWTDFIQSIILTLGGLLILGVIVAKLPGGVHQIIDVAAADGKFMLGDLMPDGKLHPAPWFPSLTQKTVIMLLLVGLSNWLTEYSSNQNVIQKYCTSKTVHDARRAMWICCWFSLPTWAYFMFLGTSLYVFFKVFPDARALEMLNGTRKAEEILPHFVGTYLPQGLSGIVIAAVLAAAMSSLSSSINAIAAVSVVDIYKRHLRKDHDDTHYVAVAKGISLASAIFMIVGAYILVQMKNKTLQDTATELAALAGGGVLGLYLLGFITTRGDGRSVFVGILFSVAFSALISLAKMGWLPDALELFVKGHFDTYYTSLVTNGVMFFLGFLVGSILPAKRDLRNLTIWTQDDTPLD